MLKHSLVFVFLIGSFFCNAQTANRFDIIISEIMADPSPQVNLPNYEWIELHNLSPASINLSGWRIGDASGQSGVMPSYLLKPDSMVIICSSGVLAAMSVYGPAVSVTSFPSLDNAGDIIYLKSPQNKIIHSVSYSDAWYGNVLKKDGGWTLEMIDLKNPCSAQNNWKASVDINGGTPGKTNSVEANNPDNDPPKLLRAFAIDSLNIVLVFDESLDSLKAVTSVYTISDGVASPQSVMVTAPMFDRISLKLKTPLTRNTIYTVTVSGVTDCTGNFITDKNRARLGLSEPVRENDIVINEILFNPKPNGTDYVEIYNRSRSILDLKQLYLANRNSLGAVSNIKPISSDNYLFFPVILW